MVMDWQVRLASRIVRAHMASLFRAVTQAPLYLNAKQTFPFCNLAVGIHEIMVP